MRRVYLVTVRGHRVPDGMTLGPVLGVFSSRKKASEHYEHVIKDRLMRGGKILWSIQRDQAWTHDERKSGTLVQGREYDEEFCFEEWTL